MPGITINVSGTVQGVGFRYFTKRLADRYHIVGTVKNEYDGSVTITAFATDELLKRFKELVAASPAPAGNVRKMTVTPLETTIIPTDFQILQYY